RRRRGEAGVRSRGEQAALAALAAVAVLAFARPAGPSRVAAVLLVPLALSVVWQFRTASRLAHRTAILVARLAVAGVFVTGLVLSLYPVVGERTIQLVVLVNGSLLAAL